MTQYSKPDKNGKKKRCWVQCSVSSLFVFSLATQDSVTGDWPCVQGVPWCCASPHEHCHYHYSVSIHSCVKTVLLVTVPQQLDSLICTRPRIMHTHTPTLFFRTFTCETVYGTFGRRTCDTPAQQLGLASAATVELERQSDCLDTHVCLAHMYVEILGYIRQSG